ncbi:hypothetical protein EIN_095790 [Entamoeba invadens IP1]|uniref:Uncharacterized protein n=1 Tax=Entamoeba invadens IP1 TaxID=370355 RepID=A0A0A1U0B4_ENTIV|nr:hypothetical protein EIN_095790 [Entamoeba invadens IP1]ELP87322.1 hypothetical protein EIN_095790 [Entamoeba invadens IP1]|eukprot:XP_004254093.1 hypothetical protein EIN_095790 [Entamoeba invadens IP1]
MKRCEIIYEVLDMVLFVGVWVGMFLLILFVFYPALPPKVTPQTEVPPQSEDYFTIVQISDPHYSKFWIGNGINRMKLFCKYSIPAVLPEAVILTGDLTKGQREPSTNYPMQFAEEWEGYRMSIDNVCKQYFCALDNNTLTYANLPQKKLLAEDDQSLEEPDCFKRRWVDTRGNHDSDGMLTGEETKNMAKKYLVNKGEKLLIRDFEKDNQTIRIILVDMFQDTSMPVDCEGVITLAQYNDIKKAILEKNTTHTILAGHYPIHNVAVEENDTLLNCLRRDFNGNLPFSMYWSGHYHQSDLQVYHKGGIREVQCPTMENRRFHLYLFKDGFIYDKDVQIYSNDALLLKPTPQKFYNHKTKFEVVNNFKYFEGVVLSDEKVANVTLTINGERYCDMHQVGDKKLYQCESADFFKKNVQIFSAKMEVTLVGGSRVVDEQLMEEKFTYRKYILSTSMFVLVKIVFFFIEIRLVLCSMVGGLICRLQPFKYITHFFPFTFIRKYRKMPLPYLLVFLALVLYEHFGYLIIGDMGLAQNIFLMQRIVLVGARSTPFHTTRLGIFCFIIGMTWYACYGVAMNCMKRYIAGSITLGPIMVCTGIFIRMLIFGASKWIIAESPLFYIIGLLVCMLIWSRYARPLTVKPKKAMSLNKVIVV